MRKRDVSKPQGQLPRTCSAALNLSLVPATVRPTGDVSA